MASTSDRTTSEKRRSNPIITPAGEDERCIFCHLSEAEASKTMRGQRWLQCSTCASWMHINCLDIKMGKKGMVPAALWEQLREMEGWIFCCPENCGDFRTVPQQLKDQRTFTRAELLAMGVRKSHLSKTDSDIEEAPGQQDAQASGDDQLDEQKDEGQQTPIYDSGSDGDDEKETEEDKWRRAGAKPKTENGARFPPVSTMPSGLVAPPPGELFNEQPVAVAPQGPVAPPVGMTSNTDMMQMMQLLFAQMQAQMQAQNTQIQAQNAQMQAKEERAERKEELERAERARDRAEREREREEKKAERESWQQTLAGFMRQGPSGSSTARPASPVERRTKIKLPHVEIPKFDGNILKWKEFWDLYNNLVHQDPDLSNVEKFSHLKNALIGEAATEIEACRITDDNYDTVIQRLKDRFNKDNVIMQQLYSQLQSLPVSGSKATELRKTYNTVISIGSQLSKLGYQTGYADFLNVKQKIPFPVIQKLEERKGLNQQWSYDLFMRSLDEYIRILEDAWAAREFQTPSSSATPKAPSTKPALYQPKTASSDQFRGRGSGAGLLASKAAKNVNSKNFQKKPPVMTRNPQRFQKYPCLYCNGWNHYAEACKAVVSTSDRKQVLIDARRCFLCLGPNHVKETCLHPRSTMPCAGCGKIGLHHQSLCEMRFDRRRQGSQTEQGTSSGQSQRPANTKDIRETPDVPNATGVSAATTLGIPTHVSSIASQPKVILQTATVSVFKPGTVERFTANVFLDNGSTDTWVTASLARRMNLPKIQKRTLNIASFNSLEPIEIQGYETEVGFVVNGQRKLVCTATIKDRLTGLIARHPIAAEDGEYLRNHPRVELAHGAVPDSFSLYNVDIIIGQEHFWDFMTNKRKITLPSGLKLLPSRFGYLIGGKYSNAHETEPHSMTGKSDRVGCSFHAITTHKEDVKKNMCIENRGDLDSSGITDCPVVRDDDRALAKFHDTIRFEDGRVTDQVTPEQLDNMLSESPKSDPLESDGFFGKNNDQVSSFQKLVGTIGYVLRYLKRLKEGRKGPKVIKKENMVIDPLTAEEREETQTFLVKGVQEKHFPQANVSYDTKYPRLLPAKSKFTELLIMDVHQRIFHYGVSHTLAQIRLKYWITHGREAVRRTLKSCLVCKQHQGGPFKMPPIPVLPKERVTEAKPFQYIGIDYFGPVWIKTETSLTGGNPIKAWVCLFTCLTTRAIHLEIVKNLSAAQFLDCFIRFVNRRGRPDRVISDNAPQFKLSDKVLDKIWAEIFSHPSVVEYAADQRIRWIYITEFAPWQGGFYERLVGLVKCGLRKGLGKKLYMYDELNTILTGIEATINSRPLTFIDSDPSEQCILTPAHLLGSNHNIGVPGIPDQPIDDYVPKLDSQAKLFRYYIHRQQHLDTFWKIWSEGYLLSLREKYGKHFIPRIHESRMPKKGEVVLIKEENLPRGRWERGRIVDFNIRRDGEISAAIILCPGGLHKKRPLNLLIPLEINPEPGVTDNSELTGKPGPSEDSVDIPTQNEAPSNRPSRRAKQVAKERIKDWIQNLNDDLVDETNGFSGLFLRLPGSVAAIRSREENFNSKNIFSK